MAFEWVSPRKNEPNPLDNTVGYWRNDQWTRGQPGLFAFIVGVSDYPHMRPGVAWDTYGFQEALYVSALSAYRMFEQVTSLSQIRHRNAIVAKVWLHLSPTPDERSAEPLLMSGEHATADFESIEQGLVEWYTAMKDDVPAGEPTSSGVFFFSGHGISYGAKRQLLLPSEWPNPVLRDSAPNKAFRTDLIHEALTVLPVDSVLFLIDACWENGVDWIERFDYEGQTPLPLPRDDSVVNSGQKRPILFAAARGRSTLQPNDPTLGLSLYTQAVIDALGMPGGTPVSDQDCDGGMCPVWFPEFVRDVKGRIEASIVAKGLTATEEVQDGGDRLSESFVTWRDEQPATGPQATPTGPNSEEERLAKHHEYVWNKGDDVGPLHDRLGHESVAWPTSGIRFFSLPFGEETSDSYTVHHIRHDEQHNEVRYDLSIKDPTDRSLWMTLSDPNSTSEGHGCLLPIGGRCTYRVLHRVVPGSRGNLVDIRLSTENPDPLGSVAEKWQRSLDRSLGHAFSEQDTVELVSAVREKGKGPEARLAAEIAAAMLYQTDFEKVPTEWLDNLANLYNSADGSVLLARRRMDEESGISATEINRVLEPVAQGGLPSLQATIEVLLSIIAVFRERGVELELASWVDETKPLLQGSGLFATYSGWIGQVGPWLGHRAVWRGEKPYEILDRYRFSSPEESLLRDRRGPITTLPVPDRVMSAGYGNIATYQALTVAADGVGRVAGISKTEIAKIADVSASTAARAIENLEKMDLLSSHGEGRATTLRLLNPVGIDPELRSGTR